MEEGPPVTIELLDQALTLQIATDEPGCAQFSPTPRNHRSMCKEGQMLARRQWNPEAWAAVLHGINKRPPEPRHQPHYVAFHSMRLYVQYHTFNILNRGYYNRPSDGEKVPIDHVCRVVSIH